MANKESLIDRMSTVGMSAFFIIIGALLIILNFTVLPVFGIIFGILLVVFGFIFLVKAQRKMRTVGGR